MKIFNILWFDDDFLPISEDISEDEKDTRNIFLEDVKTVEECGFKIVGVGNVNQFNKEISKLNYYQAVIFDLRGLDPEDRKNDNISYNAFHETKKIPGIEIFVYSANTTYEKFDLMLDDVQKKGNCFNKADGPDDLASRIRYVLEKNLNYYVDHEECLALFNENFLDSRDNRDRMDNIVKGYLNNDSSYSPYNEMRQILENMLSRLSDIDFIKEHTSKDKYETFNSRMKYLSRDCAKKRGVQGNEISDYNSPLVPFKCCNQEMKYILEYIGNMTNRYSHFLSENPEYLKYSYDVIGTKELIRGTVYNGFFAVMKWYYTLRTQYTDDELREMTLSNSPVMNEKVEESQSVILPLMFDNQLKVYHCGEYLINTKRVTNAGYQIGDNIEIISYEKNRDFKLQVKYPYFSKSDKKLS